MQIFSCQIPALRRRSGMAKFGDVEGYNLAAQRVEIQSFQVLQI